MIELPEALTLAKELNDSVIGAEVKCVLPPTKPHKFCWFSGEPAAYAEQLVGSRIVSAEGFGIYVELGFDNGSRLCVNDGVNIRLVSAAPKDYQLLIALDNGSSLVFTVAMYGGIILHGGDYDNEYYLKSKAYISPFSPEFAKHFYDTAAAAKPSLSAKAFLATEQRFPGIGNGCLQDILFAARVHPKRKIASLDEGELAHLLECTVCTLREMRDGRGRDTEKDLLGSAGSYITKMSKSGALRGCPVCGGEITKEAYLGGSVYYCGKCQPRDGI